MMDFICIVCGRKLYNINDDISACPYCNAKIDEKSLVYRLKLLNTSSDGLLRCFKCGEKTQYEGELHCRRIFLDEIKKFLFQNRMDEAKNLYLSSSFDEEWKKMILCKLGGKFEKIIVNEHNLFQEGLLRKFEIERRMIIKNHCREYLDSLGYWHYCHTQKFDRQLNEEDEIELEKFKKDIAEFISNKHDFSFYADEIEEWLDKHNSVDIKTAYNTVKQEEQHAESIDTKLMDSITTHTFSEHPHEIKKEERTIQKEYKIPQMLKNKAPNGTDQTISSSEHVSLNKILYRQEHFSYINSPQWEHRKNEILNIYNQKNWRIECVKCRSKHALQLHHNYYIEGYTNGNENISDLDYLCIDCHNKWHEIQKNSGHSQNNLFEVYFKFISNNIFENNTKALALLIEKVHMDESDILKYFLSDDVVIYQKTINKYFLMMLASFILIFFYGIGLLFILFPMIAIGRATKPKDYNIFNNRDMAIKIKKELIKKISLRLT